MHAVRELWLLWKKNWLKQLEKNPTCKWGTDIQLGQYALGEKNHNPLDKLHGKRLKSVKFKKETRLGPYLSIAAAHIHHPLTVYCKEDNWTLHQSLRANRRRTWLHTE